MDFGLFIQDFESHKWAYLAMPLMAGFIGYLTKMLALEMMFLPVEFKGMA